MSKGSNTKRLKEAGLVIAGLGAAVSIVLTVHDLLVLQHWNYHFHDLAILVRILYILANVLNVLFSLLVIAGITEERFYLLLPWLINVGAIILLNTAYLVPSAWHLIMEAPTVVLTKILVLSLAWTVIFLLFQTNSSGSEEQKLISSNSPQKSYIEVEKIATTRNSLI